MYIAHTILNRQATKLYKDVSIDSQRYRTPMAGAFPEARHGVGQGEKWIAFPAGKISPGQRQEISNPGLCCGFLVILCYRRDKIKMCH